MIVVGVYIRVSTIGQNVEGQRRQIERWLAGHKIDNAKWFIDKASGNNLCRPAFEDLQRAAFNGEIRTVVVWKLDRLSRSLRDGINILAAWCEMGLRVVSVTQQIDFSGATGKMIAAMLLGVAEMEQETRKERQAVGIAAAKERGVYMGRRKGTLKGQPERVLELREKGLADHEIGNALKLSRSTVQRYLREGSIRKMIDNATPTTLPQ
jgi:DNA invertase Pin-like site-specific DNA recombinase